jgi:hypothetical protein
MPFRQPTFLRTKVRAPIAVPGETVNTYRRSRDEFHHAKQIQTQEAVGGLLPGDPGDRSFGKIGCIRVEPD